MATAGQFPKAVGDVIYGTDYNVIHDTINTIMGTGTLGYGVVPSSFPVVEGPGTNIDAASWDLLRQDLDLIRTHQTGSISGLTDENPGMEVTAADITNYYNLAQTALSSQYTNAGGSQIALVSGTTSSYSTPWKTAIYTQTTFTFSTAAQMSNFFAAGGYIVSTPTVSGSTALSKDANWSTLVAGIPVATLGYTRADINTFLNLSVGGSVPGTQVFGSGAYSTNFYQAIITMPSTTTLVVQQTFNDASTGAGGSFDENVTLSFTASVNWYRSVGAIVSPVPTSVVVTKALGL
jgi:hypothetical protein